jgi:uncharacterized protein (TIGR03437 family)
MQLQNGLPGRVSRMKAFRFLALALAPVLLPHALYGATSTTTTLSSSPNPSTFGQPVTITVHLSSSGATGKVTIFDGVTIVGIATLSNGQAVVTTIMLPSGERSLTAHYAGDSEYSASTSQPLRQTVKSVAAQAFQISASYSLGQSPSALAAGDFNGDGKVDLAVANESSNSLSVLLGKGDGSFASPATYDVGSGPWFVSVGDFNGDGKADLVVVNSDSNNVSVLLGNGNGTFQVAVNYATGGLPAQVAVADFNSDGIADLAVTVNGSNEIDLLLGNGDGTFQNFKSYSLYRASGSAVGDFNGDRKADLAVSDASNVNIYLGNGDGTLKSSPAQYTLGPNYPGFLAAGDLNGDGKLDLVIAGFTETGTVEAWLGNGDGTLRAGSSYTVGEGPTSVAIADLNGDGKPDLVVSTFWGNSLSILYGNGDGTFQPAVTFGGDAFFGPLSVLVGDFNGDGIPDFAVANTGYNEVTIVLGVGMPSPDVAIAKTHSGTFAQDQTGATYTITVSNVGLAATSAPVSVVDSLPAGLTATALGGTGWSCTLASLECTRSDVLAANAAYPPITVTVNVAADAPISVTNTATVSGGGESNTGNDSASDVTAIHQSDAPVLSVGGIVNSSFNSGSLPASPGSLISIFGSNLGASAQNAVVDSIGRLPLSLAGASVQIGSTSAPLLYAGPNQINAQVPFELSPGSYTVTVTTAAGPSNSVNLTVTATSPGMFAGALVNNATGAVIDSANPFRPGDVIVIYCTGLGAVSPSGITGQLAPDSPLSFTTAAPTITIGGVPVQVANSVLTPGYVGLYQIGIVVPGGLPQGAQSLVVTIGGLKASPVQVFSGPSLNPQYCADVSGTWNVTQSGSVTEIAVAAIENDNVTTPFSSQGTINISQTACSISYTPAPIPGLITQDQAGALVRTGTVVGTTVSLQGLLTTATLAVSNQPDLTITQVSQNQFQSSGQLTGALLTTSDSGNFNGSGTYSYNGQTGTFTLSYVLTGSSMLVRPGVGPIVPGGTITTVAGNGNQGFLGDGGLATAASLYYPHGVATDASGNLFIADTYSERIRKVLADGIITTVAGNGNQGFSGDGGQATSASLDLPFGVTVDASGNLFIADTFNNRIRRVSTSGIITTIAGNGNQGFSGDGGLATLASLSLPRGISVDASGNLFIGDQLNNRIRKVSTSGIITTVAGNGSQGFSGDGGPAISAELSAPWGVTVDASGNLFIADANNERIREVLASGIIKTVAGNGSQGFSGDGGPAISAEFNGSLGIDIALDGSGNLFITDGLNNRIREVSTSGTITTVAGGGDPSVGVGDGGPATSASLSDPYGVAVDGSGNLFIGDYGDNRVREVTAPISSLVATQQIGPASVNGLFWRGGTFAVLLPAVPRRAVATACPTCSR